MINGARKGRGEEEFDRGRDISLPPTLYACMALIIFAAFVEQIVSRKLSKNRESRFWWLVDRLIDGRKHYALFQKKVCCRGHFLCNIFS